MHKTHGGMGFKDLTAFNLAMLGKQAWKFISEPHSLVSRIFKARYFPNNNFMPASLGHNPSYVWRSILKACFIVRGGAQWRIGSGASIPIINEPWMVNGVCLDSNTPNAHLLQNFSVNSLMHPNSKTWNEELIYQVVDTTTTASILRTPLFDQVEEDKLVWKAERTGLYSVKSAYRLCVKDLVDSSHLRQTGAWSNIWRLKVPPKVKNLVWRMCRGCLPTRVRLQDKGVNCPTDCVMCEGPSEDLQHTFFYCTFAQQIWLRSGLRGDVQHACDTHNSAGAAIFSLLQVLSCVESQQFAALLWSLWKHRNLRLWQGATETTAQVINRARHLIEDWLLTFPQLRFIAVARLCIQQLQIPLIRLLVSWGSSIRICLLSLGRDLPVVE